MPAPFINDSQETATQFVYRAIRSLMQKLIALSKSLDAEIKYHQNLVQWLFLKLLETGSTSKTITEKKPLLRNPSVSDEDLIFTVGQTSSSYQRSVKLNRSKTRDRALSMYEGGRRVFVGGSWNIFIRHILMGHEIFFKIFDGLQNIFLCSIFVI